jgi:uncharacterized protein (TIGR01777 family)
MKTIITGGTGFLGTLLTDAFLGDGHEVVILTRGTSPGRGNRARHVPWTPDGSIGPWASELTGAGAVVNLAGESIAGRRWTEVQKHRIRDSRVQATRSIVAAIRAADAPPPVFVSGSAVGYYGPHGDEIVTEDTPPSDDFLGRVAQAWEHEARQATPVTRVVCIRTGIVLHKNGGALPPMLPPFYFGVGGPVGSGRQYWPWVHWQDWVDLVRFAIHTPAVTGPLNVTSPHPVTNREFARALGRALHRPAILPAPGFALKLLLGEMADPLVLSGQRAIPARAKQLGFTFGFEDVQETLRRVLQ